MKNTSSIEKHSSAWAESVRRCDEYYKEFTAWITSDRPARSAEACHGLARDYDKALDVVIAAVDISTVTAGDQHIDLAMRYKSILSPDLEYFAKLRDEVAAERVRPAEGG